MTSSWFLIHTELRCTVNHTSDLFFLSLLNVDLSAAVYCSILAMNNRMTNGELNEMWKKVKVVGSDVVSQHFPAGSEEPNANQNP